MNARVDALATPDSRGVTPWPAVLTVGFGTAVAMWTVAYVGRLPAMMWPGPILLVLLAACLVGGGFLARQLSGAHWGAAAAVGGIAGLVNLLVLGSFLTADSSARAVPSAWLWIPGFILVSMLLVVAGSLIGRRAAIIGRPVNWRNAFVWVAVAATLLLLAAGGVVTSAEAGLAVDDWPTSFGYNMFLYPFSRMTGGIYYEHAHRLVGALVGLTTVVMAIVLELGERRRWVRTLAWAAVAWVIVQGTLGGLRVTGRSVALAMTHGVVAQIFLATLVALAAITSTRWRSGTPPEIRASVGTDRVFGLLLLGSLVCQLLLGAAQRHFQALLMVHIVTGVALVLPLAFLVGIRAWGLNATQPVLRRHGIALVAAAVLQVILGFAAYVATAAGATPDANAAGALAVATAHQWFGAVVLATAVSLVLWGGRLLRREGA